MIQVLITLFFIVNTAATEKRLKALEAAAE